ncbi:MAG: hypothetical protein AB7V32_01495, partial [Candidatus Berkiella sp.]
MIYKDLTVNTASYPQHEDKLKALIALIPSIPELDDLITKATKNGPIKIDFVPRSELDTGGVYQEHGEERYENGVWSRTIKRNIKIAREKSFKEALDTLIFELCNAKNPYFQMYIDDSVSPEKYEDREAYALASEIAEYTCTQVPAKAIT